MFQTPVVLILFNRPDLTKIVFEAIAQVKPAQLLVIADGPREPEEAEKCNKARAVIERVDWNCQILTNFSDKNLGCKRRVSSGLDWVFSIVEEAIILEDDCLPAPTFFSFCETLLKRYRYDERIMMISGNNFQRGQNKTEYSYYFSKYSHIWGWASWRRAWRHYDVDMKTWPKFKKMNWLCSVCTDSYEQRYWMDRFDSVFDGAIDTWDYQLLYAYWCQSGLAILPNSNLVSNIGFRLDATHTFADSPWARLPTTDIWEIKHPPSLVRHRDADTYTFNYFYGGKDMRRNAPPLYRAKHYVKSLRNRLILENTWD